MSWGGDQGYENRRAVCEGDDEVVAMATREGIPHIHCQSVPGEVWLCETGRGVVHRVVLGHLAPMALAENYPHKLILLTTIESCPKPAECLPEAKVGRDLHGTGYAWHV